MLIALGRRSERPVVTPAAEPYAQSCEGAIAVPRREDQQQQRMQCRMFRVGVIHPGDDDEQDRPNEADHPIDQIAKHPIRQRQQR